MRPNPVPIAEYVRKILLRIARSNQKIHGKCALSDPETGTWRKVNLERVREAVLETLR
ncbi:MAG: hypothetical protein IMZ75_00270 [Actinobacteria bacterium]|nr:hypothetical protein [Actinomycetota bacterium]